MDRSVIFSIPADHKFFINRDFIDSYKDKEPNWGALSKVAFTRTYARKLEGEELVEHLVRDKGMTAAEAAAQTDAVMEAFWQTARRCVEFAMSVLKHSVVAGHRGWNEQKGQKQAKDMFKRLWDGKWLPPGRGLQFAGTPVVEKKGAAVLNSCGFFSTAGIGKDFAGPFCGIMDFLMLGVGMGSDVKGADKFTVQAPVDSEGVYCVEDTREGWVDAFRVKLKSYTGGPRVTYDYSLIREYGAPLKTFGGTSSGYIPLKNLLDSVDTILAPRIGQKIGVTAIADLINQIGVCVVAGNIRRSAEILLGEEGDEEFTKLKDPSQLRDWQRNLKDMEDGPNKLNLLEKISTHPLYTHRWASNNSLMCKVDSNFASLLPSIQSNGEPGVLFMDNIRAYSRMSDPRDNRDAKVAGCNPCSEQCLEDNELCCLGELNPNAHDSLDDFLDTIKCAYLYCKAVTMLPTNNPKTNRIIAKNRRIGLSMMGIWKMYERLGLQTCIKWWDAGYKEVRRCDAVYSEWLGCNQSIKVTSVKPGGTVPLLLSEEGGMKPPTARYYFRTVRVEQASPIVDSCRAAGYRVEQDKASPNTVVIYFPCHDVTEMRTSSEITIWEQLELLAALQGYWSDNMVSNTITFKPEEASQIGPALKAFAHRIKSVSFLPLVTHGYEQAPYIPITAEEYESAIATLSNLDLSKVTEHEVDEKYCTGEACMIPQR